MTAQTRKLLTIVLNLILVGFICWAIYDEYRRVGKFQWVDSNAIEDHEELYLTPIFVIIALLGTASVLYETLSSKRASTNVGQIITSLFRWLSLIYGAFLMIVSLLFIFMALGNIGNHDYEKGLVLSVSILLLTLISVGLLGGLIIYNDIKKQQLKRGLRE